MTVNSEMSPVYLLRSYAWQVIKANTNLTEADYGGLTPIVSLAEEPDLSQYNKPHIVYGYSLDATGDLYARQRGSMAFGVYSTNFRELTKLLNILGYAFGRQDASAKDINDYTSKVTNFLGIRFGYVELAFVEGGTPEIEEGGRQSGIVNIRFEYYMDYGIKTRDF